jgi:hypothetical protein
LKFFFVEFFFYFSYISRIPELMSVGESQSSVDPSEIRFASKWSLWSSVAGGNKGWELQELFSVDSAASFWKHFNAMKLPSELGNGAVEMALFRSGVQPDWEMEPCSKGGRWSARLDRVSSPDSLDQTWLNLVLALVGESILEEENDDLEILGVAFSGKGPHSRRIAVWTGIREKERVLQIGHAIKETLRVELTDKDIGEMLFHDFESGNKSFAVIANSAKRERRTTTPKHQA